MTLQTQTALTYWLLSGWRMSISRKKLIVSNSWSRDCPKAENNTSISCTLSHFNGPFSAKEAILIRAIIWASWVSIFLEGELKVRCTHFDQFWCLAADLANGSNASVPAPHVPNLRKPRRPIPVSFYEVRWNAGNWIYRFPFSILVWNSSRGRGGGPLIFLPRMS